jgi:hypothetical protein
MINIKVFMNYNRAMKKEKLYTLDLKIKILNFKIIVVKNKRL